MALFSVIIPAYNRVDLVGQTLDSVLNQEGFDRSDFEVIVVDDGSTDGTLEVLEDFSRRQGVRVLRQSNRGPGAARNLGLQQASGEYAAFLDSDDLWFPWTLKTYRDAIAAHSRPAFVSGREMEFSQPKELPKSNGDALAVEAFGDYLASWDRWRWFSASSFVLRRDAALSAGGYDGGWGVAEDADLAMKLGLAPGFVHISSPVTFGYRVHGGNIMKNMGRIFVGTSLLVDHEKGGHYAGGNGRRRERLEIVARHARWCSVTCLLRGERQMAWDLFLRTIGWHIRLNRWRYLAGFPIRMIASAISSKPSTR